MPSSAQKKFIECFEITKLEKMNDLLDQKFRFWFRYETEPTENAIVPFIGQETEAGEHSQLANENGQIVGQRLWDIPVC